jgi:uncharacterized membrane protein (UPF0136 family)
VQNTVLWIYIVLLVVGGLIGFLKAGSKVSLQMASAFAVALILLAIPDLFAAGFRRGAINVLLAVLLIVFTIRLVKTKKFMPAGMMVIATLITLVVRNINF